MHTHRYLALIILISTAVLACRTSDDIQNFDEPEARTPLGTFAHPAITQKPIGMEKLDLPKLSAEEPEPYASSIHVNAACTGSNDLMYVPKGHDPPALCEQIVMTALTVDDGQEDAIGLPFVWLVQNPDLITMDCSASPDQNHCAPLGMQDLFDLESVNEPTTTVTGCAVNTCPPNNTACEPLVCADVSVTVVVNLEGSWFLTGGEFQSGKTISLSQEGHELTSAHPGFSDGAIDADTVSITIGDYLYIGTIKEDRATIIGDTVDLLTLSWVGSWSAERVSP